MSMPIERNLHFMSLGLPLSAERVNHLLNWIVYAKTYSIFVWTTKQVVDWTYSEIEAGIVNGGRYTLHDDEIYSLAHNLPHLIPRTVTFTFRENPKSFNYVFRVQKFRIHVCAIEELPTLSSSEHLLQDAIRNKKYEAMDSIARIKVLYNFGGICFSWNVHPSGFCNQPISAPRGLLFHVNYNAPTASKKGWSHEPLLTSDNHVLAAPAGSPKLMFLDSLIASRTSELESRPFAAREELDELEGFDDFVEVHTPVFNVDLYTTDYKTLLPEDVGEETYGWGLFMAFLKQEGINLMQQRPEEESKRSFFAKLKPRRRYREYPGRAGALPQSQYELADRHLPEDAPERAASSPTAPHERGTLGVNYAPDLYSFKARSGFEYIIAPRPVR